MCNIRTNDWISVKERLPEFRPEQAISDYVLGYDGEQEEMVIVAWSRWDWDGKGGTKDRWVDANLEGGYDDVTHWMPLPAPPTPELTPDDLTRRQKDVAEYNVNAEEQRQFDEADQPDPEESSIEEKTIVNRT